MNSIRLLADSLDSFYSANDADPALDAPTPPLLLDSDPDPSPPSPPSPPRVSPSATPSLTDPVSASHSLLSYVVHPFYLLWLIATFPVTYLITQLGLSLRRDPRSSVALDFASSHDPYLPQRDEKILPGENIPQDIQRDLVQTLDTNHLGEKDVPLANDISLTKLPASEKPLDDEKSTFLKTELLKQESFISNDIKSPNSCAKYIIPPPQRLYPLSRNPNKVRKKKTLILDLDETLIHSLSRGLPRGLRTASPLSPPRTIEIRINDLLCLYYVYKRPYCDYFLQQASQWFDLQIFTASVQEYADPIVDWLENDLIDHRSAAAPRLFSRRHYRHHCTYKDGVGYIKDLSRFFSKEEDLKNVILLDNSPISYALHHDNGIMIEGWINDHSDRELLHLLPMLHSLSLCIDVRYILGMKQGEGVFEC